ncbi:hypothetical protein [Actinocorallia populi]|uniref:hypothetical protein n=1 Tax=Actinocorallia populi TaxID=2079200 RepID=UPI000D097201|nr:hypothetical protein [Actinocorallia populi]
MSPRTKIVLAGGAAAVVLWLILPNLLATLVILGLIAVPVAAYLLLDPSQRSRVRAQGRKRLGP